MKNKIAFKLIAYFSAALLLFSFIIGALFSTLFKKHTMELHKDDMDNRATAIATTLSSFYDNKGMGPGMGHGQYGAYFRFIDEIAMTDIWIVDEDLKLITLGKMSHRNYNYGDLPEDGEVVVKEVFKGNTTYSQGFSKLLDAPTLTLGKPIISANTVVGAVLLHSSIEGMDGAISQGIKILLISLIFALILSLILSILLAIAFTKPLNKMKDSAALLAIGDYSAKTGVKQNDEIGDLAKAIDILSEKLDEASRESEKLQRLRNDFISNISHELRTPVTVIRGSIEALRDEVITDKKKTKEYYGQMLKESIFLQRLINDLLDLSRLQNTDFQIDIKEVNICDLLKDVSRSIQNLAKKKDIKILKEFDKDMFIINGDYGRLRQMFLIILDNALKFSPNNSQVKIILKKKQVSIIDKGPGISPEDLPYIFERFYKVKSVDNKEGTGLGLAISKEIANRHNIKLSVKSEEKKETEFIFEF